MGLDKNGEPPGIVEGAQGSNEQVSQVIKARQTGAAT
jgi:hypothetical protein